MSPHRTIIKAGPEAIRRLCCGTTADAENSDALREALDAIDDPTVLVDGRPVTVDSLWRTALRSLDWGSPDGLIVVHPSWWSARRIGVVNAAAESVVADVETQPRSWLLVGARPDAGAGGGPGV